jgi:hypothetical protein
MQIAYSTIAQKGNGLIYKMEYMLPCTGAIYIPCKVSIPVSELGMEVNDELLLGSAE